MYKILDGISPFQNSIDFVVKPMMSIKNSQEYLLRIIQ